MNTIIKNIIVVILLIGLGLFGSFSCGKKSGDNEPPPSGGGVGTSSQGLAPVTECLQNGTCDYPPEVVDNDAESPDNAPGSVHVSYNSTDGVLANNELKYALRDANGNWNEETVDTGGVGWYSSLKADSNDDVHISYYHIVNQTLKYATNASGSWVSATVDASSADVGWSTSLVIDSNDKVHITYFDAANWHLRYATNASGSWVTSIIDSSADVGYVTSLAIDDAVDIDSLHAAYPDDTNGTLKYATKASGGAWVVNVTPIDTIGSSTGLRGFYLERITAIDVDAGGFVHIAYYDIADRDLYHATNATGSWVTTPVDDSAEDVGSATSIETYENGSDQVVLIFYFDADNTNLKYAINTAAGIGAWVTSTPSIIGDIGEEPSISVKESTGEFHVTSLDPTTNQVVYTPPIP